MFNQYLLFAQHLDPLRDGELVSLRFLIKLAFSMFNCCLAFGTFFLITVIYRDAIFNMVIFTMQVFRRFKRFESIYLNGGGKMTTRQANRFMSKHNETFQSVLSLNSIYRWMMLVALAISYPINAFLIIDTFIKSNKALAIFINLMFLMSQFQFIVFIHLLAVMYSARIHGFTKRMLSLNCRLTWHNLVDCLRLAHYIEKFHTSKRFGLQYGCVGLVSVTAFAKFLFIYIRFLFLFYSRSRTNV